MQTKPNPVPAGTIPFWALWRNPIFRRYIRSRLRPKTLIGWGLVTLLLTAFVFALAYLAPQRRMDQSAEQAARYALVPLVLIQCAILMFKGTFSVASGIAREGIEGTLDYQRLTPMGPRSKIFGYLFGLPVQEYALFFLTVPFTLFAVAAGGVPWEMAGKCCLVLFSSVLLYHMTGLMAGMVTTRRFLVGFLSQFLIFALYFVLPQLSAFGYVFFEYLTVRPVLLQQMHELFPRAVSRAPQTVPFFQMEFSVTVFSLCIQLGLFTVFFLVVRRKWKQATHHLLGKNLAVVIFTGILFVFLGSILPLIESGKIFPSQANEWGIGRRGFFSEEALPVGEEERRAIPGLFGCVLFLLTLGMISVITPAKEQILNGLRRAKKLGLPRMRAGSDAATSCWHSLALSLLGVAAWVIFVYALFSSHWYKGLSLEAYAWALFPLSLLLPALCFQMLLEMAGRQRAFLAVLLLWIAPLLSGIVLAAASEKLTDFAIYLVSICGFILPFLGIQAGISGVRGEYSETMTLAFFLSLIFYLTVFPLLLLRWRKFHQSLAGIVREQSQRKVGEGGEKRR